MRAYCLAPLPDGQRTTSTFSRSNLLQTRSPAKDVHIALREIRRLDLIWQEDQTPDYDKLVQMSDEQQEELPAFVKDILRRHTGD